MIIQPQEYFVVARELADPNDTGTYYVRATIRNARTQALLGTLDLTDQGDQLFTKEWQAPADPSGLGFYIIVRTRVYTNSGYTSLSADYGQELSTYLIDDRFRIHGGGGGGDVDYKKIRKIFREVLDAFPFPKVNLEPIMDLLKPLKDFQTIMISFAKTGELKLGRIFERLLGHNVILKQLKDRRFPEIKETDFSPVLKAIKDKKEPTDTDLSPVMREIGFLRGDVNADAVKKLTDTAGNLQKLLTSDEFKKQIERLPELAESAKKIESGVKDLLYATTTSKGSGEKKEAELEQKPDYREQASMMVGRLRVKK